MSDEPGQMLDLGPALIAKKRSECKHPYALVDDVAASLTCSECGAELDPWTFLRKLAHDEELWRKRFERYRDLEAKAEAKYREHCASLDAKLKFQTDEINRLIETKNRLWNERDPATGQPIGSLARRSRRRLASGKPTSQG